MATASETTRIAAPSRSYGGLKNIPDDVLMRRYGLFRDELDALKQTVAPQASDYDLLIFLATARRLGLDVLVPGMLQLMKFEGKTGTRWVTNIGFRGELALAEATGELLMHKETVEFDKQGNPTRATCSVWRKNWPEPYVDSISMEEAKNERNALWEERPETMLKNAAIKRAVSLAFPKRFGPFKEYVKAEGVEYLAPGEKGTGLSIPGEHHDAPTSNDVSAERTEVPTVPITVEARPTPSPPAPSDTKAGDGVKAPVVPAKERLTPPAKAESGAGGPSQSKVVELARAVAEAMDDPGLTREQKGRMWELLNERLDSRKLQSTWTAKPEDVPLLESLLEDLTRLRDGT